MSDSFHRRLVIARWFGLTLLFAPALGLFTTCLMTSSLPLLAGAIISACVAARYYHSHPVWRPPAGLPVALMFGLAAGLLWVDARVGQEPLARVLRGSFAMIGVVLLAINELFRSGSEPRRRAALVCRKLLARPHWPLTLADCRTVPEVDELRDAVREDISPLMRLMADPRPEVRAAAFASLEGRPFWRPNEALLILDAARSTIEPGVRAAATAALTGVRQIEILLEVAQFLRDPALEVRFATAHALLRDSGDRWPLYRECVKAAMSDPRLAGDGALPGSAGLLPVLAICDLTAWATEGGNLADRSVRTLVEHYHDQLKTSHRADLAIEFGRMVLDPSFCTELRVGLAHLLKKHQLLDARLLDRMTNADQPGPIRLLAAEVLLSVNADNADGLDVLRGLGRQQNREIALSIARILQTYLGIDFGLPPGGMAANTKAAGDVVKRVVQWASGKGLEPKAHRSERPTPLAIFGSLEPAAARSSHRSSDDDEEIDFGGGPVTGPQSIIQ